MKYKPKHSVIDRLIEDKRQEMIDSGIANGYLDFITIKLSKELDDLLNLKRKLGEKKNGYKQSKHAINKRKIIG